MTVYSSCIRTRGVVLSWLVALTSQPSCSLSYRFVSDGSSLKLGYPAVLDKNAFVKNLPC